MGQGYAGWLHPWAELIKLGLYLFTSSVPTPRLAEAALGEKNKTQDSFFMEIMKQQSVGKSHSSCW